MLVGVDTGPSVALGAHLIAQLGSVGSAVRVGIATGTALLFEGDDYIGEPVNLAARLCAAANPGEVLAACARADLPYWIKVAGTHSIELKGIGTVTDVLRLQPSLQ
jgi:class 3 adenylate cyclase